MYYRYFIGTLFLCFCVIYPMRIHAETEESIRNQIQSTNNQIQALDREIKKYQDQITQTGTEKSSLAKII